MTLELPSYISPAERDHNSYFDYINQFNINLQKRVSKHLADTFSINPHSSIAILTTGSDGRLDKGPQSKIELVILKEEPLSIDGLVADIKQTSETNSGTNIFEHVDVKDLESDSMAFYHNQKDRAFPGRIIESRLLAGNDYLCKKSKGKLYLELIGPEGSSIKDRTKNKEKEYKKIMETGKQTMKGETTSHFDKDSGVAFFNPETSQSSFKYGPLRYMQFVFIYDIVNHARQKQSREFIDDLPSNIADRLYELELRDMTKLSRSNVAELADHYKFFLWAYHMSQEGYRNNGQTEMQFEATQVRERIEAMGKMLQNRIIKMD